GVFGSSGYGRRAASLPIGFNPAAANPCGTRRWYEFSTPRRASSSCGSPSPYSARSPRGARPFWKESVYGDRRGRRGGGPDDLCVVGGRAVLPDLASARVYPGGRPEPCHVRAGSRVRASARVPVAPRERPVDALQQLAVCRAHRRVFSEISPAPPSPPGR